MADGGFLFIEVDGPQTRRGNARPKTQRYETHARKFVMRGTPALFGVWNCRLQVD